MSEVETIIIAIINAVGVDRILKFISGNTPEEQVRQILDAEYAAVRAAADELAKSKFGG